MEKNGKAIEKTGVPPCGGKSPGLDKTSSLDERERRDALMRKVREKEAKKGGK